MSTIRPQTLEALRRALEKMTMECPHWDEEAQRHFPYKDSPIIGQLRCYHCVDVDGRVPDPQAAALLEVVREGCPCLDDIENECISCHISGLLGIEHGQGCKTCQDTDYFTRTAYWQAAPEGALAGALLKGIPLDFDAGAVANLYDSWDEGRADTDEWAAQAVIRGLMRDCGQE